MSTWLDERPIPAWFATSGSSLANCGATASRLVPTSWQLAIMPGLCRPKTGRSRVHRAVDRAKDQSYVLFGLRRELLPHVLFPVGGYTKTEIRSLAREYGLPVHDKPDSQDICFVPDDDYLAFVRDRRPERDTQGRSLTRTASSWASTPGLKRSRSASAGVWESRWERRGTWCKSSP